MLFVTITFCYFILQVLSTSSNERNSQRPQFHIVAPKGTWINDPNGPIYDDITGNYHLFVQANPNDYVWGNISWDHYISTDLLHWNHLPLALVPRNNYDINGCFSGSSLIIEDRINLYYTCVDRFNNQCICSAKSKITGLDPERIEYQKDIENPFTVPSSQQNKKDFRDPALWIQDNKVIKMIIAARSNDEGIIEVFRKNIDDENNKDFEYFGKLWTTSQSQSAAYDVPMIECPDLFPVIGSNYSSDYLFILKYSVMETRKDYFQIGNYISFNESFRSLKKFGDFQIDYGPYFSYYASKSLYDSINSRRLIFGWSSETDDNAENREWQGIITLPRILNWENDTLKIQAIPELNKLRSKLLYNDKYSLIFDNNYNDNIYLYNYISQGLQIDFITEFYISSYLLSENVEIGYILNSNGYDINDKNKFIGSTVSIIINDAVCENHILLVTDTTFAGGSTPQNRTSTCLPLPISNLNVMNNMRVIIDHSIIEIFIMESVAATLRVYSPLDCNKFGIFSRLLYNNDDKFRYISRPIEFNLEAYTLELKN